MIISRTPFRISFFGGGTDYPAWYRNHGGAVLATTIDKYCYITCRYLPPFFSHRYRVAYSKIETCHKVEEIQHPAVRQVLSYLGIDPGLEIHHDGDLPARSGMGSSSAFTVGLLNALYALKGQIRSKQQLVEESIYVEQELLKETVGSQDQVSAAYGGFNHIRFSQTGEISVRPMTLPQERIQELNSHLVLLFTGVNRTASEVAKTYVQDIERRGHELQMIGKMADEGIDILNGSRDITEFGELMHNTWQAKRSLSSQVSSSRVDDIYQRARSKGAIGGKLLGAGGGGFILFFVRPRDQAKVLRELSELLHVPFRFEHSGSQIIFADTA